MGKDGKIDNDGNIFPQKFNRKYVMRDITSNKR